MARPFSHGEVTDQRSPDGASYTLSTAKWLFLSTRVRRVVHTGRVSPRRWRGRCAGPRRRGDFVSGEAPKGRQFARRRRANVEGGRPHRHEVKVSPEEEGILLRLAAEQRVTVPRLLVESTLTARSETPSERRNAMAELFALHRLLASISNNVNQMAKATNATGEVQEELSATLSAVRRTALRIDDAIDGLSLP